MVVDASQHNDTLALTTTCEHSREQDERLSLLNNIGEYWSEFEM